MLFPFEYPQLVLNMCYLFYRLKYCISIFLSFFGPFYGFKGWESNPGPLQSLGTWDARTTNRAKRRPVDEKSDTLWLWLWNLRMSRVMLKHEEEGLREFDSPGMSTPKTS